MRDLTSEFITELEAPNNRPIWLVYLEFLASNLYLWNGVGDLTAMGEVWNGNGWLQGVDPAPESSEVESNSAQITLTGIPSSVLELCLNQAVQRQACEIYFAFLDAEGAVVPDPYLMFSGKLDVPVINESADTTIVTITYEDLFIDLNRSKNFRYNKESQKVFYPLDHGFDRVGSAESWNGFWGNQKKKPQKRNKRSTKNGSKRGSRRQ